MLRLHPISIKEANGFVGTIHRHHGESPGGKFAISVRNDIGRVVGIAIVGRPVSRRLDDGLTAEVVRLATDGTKNACSMLYGASWRAAKAMGYARIGSYILCTEPGTSLKASGWKLLWITKGGSWAGKTRVRKNLHPTIPKKFYGIGEW